MKHANIIYKYAAVICIPIYITFTFISHLYNTKLNPLTNWLSDFGNPLMNPSGAVFYNMGCIIVAILLIVFYIGIYHWYRNRIIAKKYIICYVLAQISGIMASIFLILASLFPLGTNTDLHKTFGTVNMIGIDCFLDFTAISFFMNPNIKKRIGIIACLTATFNIITTNVFSSLFIAEWIYFLLFMLYLLLITLNYDKLCYLRRGARAI